MNRVFGRYSEKLIKQMAVEHSSDTATLITLMERTHFASATIYKWQQGRLIPPIATVHELVRLGYEYGLDREWADHLIHASGHAIEAEILLNDVFGPLPAKRKIPHNLPPTPYMSFIGRAEMLHNLLTKLSPRVGINPIPITGIGGAGKTAFALRAAHLCLQVSEGSLSTPYIPTFDAIIFVSSKETRLIPGGVVRENSVTRSLDEILRTILIVLGWPAGVGISTEEQQARVLQALGQQRVLLIVDNMETLLLAQREAILHFLYQLPPTIKAIITSREQFIYSPFQLTNLPKDEAIWLVQREAFEHHLKLSVAEIQAYVEVTDGVPGAIIYAMGLRAWNYSLESVLATLKDAQGDLAYFFFQTALEAIRNTPAYYLLLAASLFPKSPRRDAVVAVAAIEPIMVEKGLLHLAHLSLIKEHDYRLTMLELTREYLLAELVFQPILEQEMRTRWVSWHLNLVQKYGGQDWDNYQIRYDQIEPEWSNLIAVFEWCAVKEQFESLVAFWGEDEGLEDFANIYGYWSDRLTWTDWLISATERRGAWELAAKLLTAQSWLLILRGDPRSLAESEVVLERAWALWEYATPLLQVEMLLHRAIYGWRNKAHEAALFDLDRSEAILRNSASTIDKLQGTRTEVSLWFYRGLVYYERGLYKQSRVYLQRAFTLGEEVKWQRVGTTIGNWLADICIALGELGQAEKMIRTNLATSKRLKDGRRLHFYERSFAYYYMARQDTKEAKRWAQKALAGFEQFEMHPEIQELRKLIDEIGD